SNLRHDSSNIKTMIKGELIDTGFKKLGVIIGDNSKIAINTMFYPGRILPSNSFTIPGEIIK
ncbi:MAG: glucose-1-phosphate thymidylyltransferase, partial [Candidatus Gracilibacteria bacterium]|nr:glucose-1-phosphate thymidylyltransferase [Candidatus Gracilibacteria bacterium]